MTLSTCDFSLSYDTDTSVSHKRCTPQFSDFHAHVLIAVSVSYIDCLARLQQFEMQDTPNSPSNKEYTLVLKQWLYWLLGGSSYDDDVAECPKEPTSYCKVAVY